ncbi:MAG: PorT family protein [Treponema sp.]|jgi:TolB-like protein|nr:PorT family protein [Treponema sp.]
MIVVLGFKGPNIELQNYIVDGVLDNLVTNDAMRVIDRKNAELIQQEHDIQLSGDVGDDYIQGIGHQFRAEYIITGSFEQNEDFYRLRLEMINVRTAELVGRSTQNIEMDAILAALLQVKWEQPAPWKHKLFAFGVRFGGDLGFYNNAFVSDSISKYSWDIDIFNTDPSFGIIGSISAGVNIFDWLGVQVEFMYKPIETQIQAKGVLAGDYYVEGYGIDRGSWAFEEGAGTIKYNSIVIPILAKFMYKPKNFYFAGLLGPYFGFPVGDATFSGKFYEINWEGLFKPIGISMGFTVGANAGLKLGPGIIFLDIRYSFNIKEQDFEPVNGSISNAYFSGAKWEGFDMPYLNASGGDLSFMLGYEFLLVNKKK